MPRDYIPYVFSNAEMKRIFSVIDSRESAYDRYDSRLFYQTLIRLLYCTGLRLGEALELKISDIDFTDNIIIVNSGKGNDVVNITLHFFLKDIRPMLPPAMNHSIAVS